MAQTSITRCCLFALLLAAVYLTHLGSARLWDRDEPRNSRASQEMLERGDWVVPTFNGELRTHKPVLLYWGQMVSYLALGESEFAARLPSVLCALLTVLAIAVLASRLSGRKRGLSGDGLWAAAALGTSLFFVMAGRAATPDACLIAFSTLGIAGLVLATLRGAAPYSAGSVGSARWLPAMFGYAMLGLAVLAKGPVGIVLPLAVVHLWWLLCRRLDQVGASKPAADSAGAMAWLSEAWGTFNPIRCLEAIWQLKVLPGVIVCAAIAVPWYYYVGVATDGAFLRGFLWEHNVGRAVSSMEGHGGSIFFYPAAFMAGTFPWSLWLIPIGLWASRQARVCPLQRQLILLGVCWIGIYIVAFTIASTKLPSYITPCYAGAALIIGAFLRQFESGWSLPSFRLRHIAYGITCGVGLLIAGVIYWLSQENALPLMAWIAAAGGCIVAMGCMAMLLERFGKTELVPLTWLAGAVGMNVVLFGFGTATVDRYRTELDQLAELREQLPASPWLSIGGMEPSWVFYLGSEIQEVREHPSDPRAWEQVDAFAGKYEDGLIIAVGTEAQQTLVDRYRTSGIRLESVSEGQRFLEEQPLTVYRVVSEPELRRTAGAESNALR